VVLHSEIKTAGSWMLRANILRVFFFNTFLNICGFYVMQFGDISLTRMTLWISLVYHLENVSLIFVSLWRFAVEKISLLITVCLFQSIGFLPLLDD